MGGVAEPGERLVSEVIKDTCMADGRERMTQRGPLVQKSIYGRLGPGCSRDVGETRGAEGDPLLGPTENCEAEGVTPKGRRQGWQGSGQSPSSE